MSETTFLVNIDDAIQLARNIRSAGFKLMRMNRGSWWVGDEDMLIGKPALFKIVIDRQRAIPQGSVLKYERPSPLFVFQRPEIQFDSSAWRPFVTNFAYFRGYPNV